jgi:hypothetical protein
MMFFIEKSSPTLPKGGAFIGTAGCFFNFFKEKECIDIHEMNFKKVG